MIAPAREGRLQFDVAAAAAEIGEGAPGADIRAFDAKRRAAFALVARIPAALRRRGLNRFWGGIGLRVAPRLVLLVPLQPAKIVCPAVLDTHADFLNRPEARPRDFGESRRAESGAQPAPTLSVRRAEAAVTKVSLFRGWRMFGSGLGSGPQTGRLHLLRSLANLLPHLFLARPGLRRERNNARLRIALAQRAQGAL